MADIEISQVGISTSWRRFIADAVTGYTVYLLLFLAYLNNWSIFGYYPCKLRSDLSDWHVMALLGVLLFFLAPAVGVVIDTIGRVFLFGLQDWLEDIWYKHRWWYPEYLKKLYLYEKCQKTFDFDDKDRRLCFRKLVEVFNAYHPPATLNFDAMVGYGVFFRNLAVISLVVGAAVGYEHIASYCWIVLVPVGAIWVFTWSMFRRSMDIPAVMLVFLIMLAISHPAGWNLNWSREVVLPAAIGGGGFCGFILLSSWFFLQHQLMTFAAGWAWYLIEDTGKTTGGEFDEKLKVIIRSIELSKHGPKEEAKQKKCDG